MSSGDPEPTVTDAAITTVETVVTTQDDNMVDADVDQEVYYTSLQLALSHNVSL